MGRFSAILLAIAGYSFPASAVEFSQETFAGKKFTVCRVNITQEKLRLFLRDESDRPYKRMDVLAKALGAKHETLVFAMNAGMYHADFSPVGLFIADRRQLAPLNLDKGVGNFFLKPNGVFAITDKGAVVVESSAFPNIKGQVQLATQSGPLLVRAGQIHPAFKSDSKSRLHRNGVGVPSPGIAVFAITEEPVNFFEFATFFRDALKCPDALFLDGTISSLWSEKLNRRDFRMDLGPIIGVTQPQ